MVRDTLGEDAVIVATREENGGKSVHVTAAIEPSAYDDAFELGRGGTEAAESSDWLQYDEEDEVSAVEEEITDVLLRHGVTEDVMDHILSCATVIGLENPGISLLAAIEHLFNFRPLPSGAHSNALMMVGAPGAGKTLISAKIAARGVMDGLNVGVISTDTIRAGGVEQLEAFTKLLGIDLIQANNPRDLPLILDELREENLDQIIVDTSGFNPFDRDEMKAMAQLIGSAPVDPYLIMPAGGDAEESAEIAKACATIGVQGIIPTRVDIARRLGGVLSSAYQAGLPYADLSNTPKVADGLEAVTPQALSKLLMPSAYPDKAQRQKSAAPSQARGRQKLRRTGRVTQ